MTRLVRILLIAFFSLSIPAIERNPDFWRSSIAAETGASSAANAARLRSQLTAEEIAGGHAFDKHVIHQGQFPGVTTSPQFATEIENVINNASEVRPLSNGRTAYWDSSSGTVVIRNPGAVDGGTAFKPTQGKTYFDNLK